MTSSAAALRSRRRRRIAAGAGATAVLVALGAGVAVAGTRGSSPRYRLATATTADVRAQVDTVGTVEPVTRQVVAFPVAGTVASVQAVIGQPVTPGQALATLSTTALAQQVDAAGATLARDRQTLATDEASQTSTTGSPTTSSAAPSSPATSSTATSSTATRSTATRSTGSSSTPATTTRTSTGPTGSGASTGGGSGPASTSAALVRAVTAAQSSLLRAQHVLDQDLMSVQQALDTCRAALTGAGPAPAPSGSTSGSPTGRPSAAPTTGPTSTASSSPTTDPTSSPTSSTGSPTTSPSGSPTSPTSSSGEGGATCLAAIAAAPGQATTRADQSAVAAATSRLTRVVDALSTSAPGATAPTSSTGSRPAVTAPAAASTPTTRATTTSRGSTAAGSATAGSTAAGSTAAGSTAARTGASSGPATAQQLTADQMTIDADQAQLSVAQQNRSLATLTAPIAGTVAAVSLTAGRSVGASSTSATVTIVGPGQVEVSTSVPLSAVARVAVGQHAQVTVDGQSAPTTGTVTVVGVLSSASGSSTTYPVTILLAGGGPRPVYGAGATVSIDTGTASGVLTVPSSAVHRVGTASTVTVLSHGAPVVTPVTTGVAGTDRVQVLSGLTAGTQVVLATLGTPLPTATSSFVTRRLGVTGGGGALTGGTTGPAGGGAPAGGRPGG